MRRVEPAVILLAILTALAASGLWLWTECSHHRATTLVDRVLAGKPLARADLAQVLEKIPPPRREILPGKHLFHESTLAIASADLPDLPEAVRLQWLGLARQTFPDALAREPANAHAWTHLAYATWLFEGPNPTSVEALRMSIYASPANKQLLLWRLKLAGLNRDFWDPGFRDLLPRQVSLAWKHAPKLLAEIAATHHILDLIGQVLSNDPAELARFEKLAANFAAMKQGG